MDFSIIALLDDAHCTAWVMKHCHPNGLTCPPCHGSHAVARFFRINRGRGLPVWRCHRCHGVYTLSSGTLFAASHVAAVHVVLILRGVVQGHPSAHLARDIGLTEKTVVQWRHRLHAHAEHRQPASPLPDRTTESEEMVQNAGGKT